MRIPPPGGAPYEAWGPPPAGLDWHDQPGRAVGPTNPLAIAALVVATVALFPIAVPLGIVALRQTQRTGRPGRGLAIAALWISVGWALVIAMVITIGVAFGSNAGHGSTALRTGDCVVGLAGPLRSSTVVTCATPHEGEVVGIFDLPNGPYPGDAAVEAKAKAGCKDLLGRYSPSALADDSVEVSIAVPSPSSWAARRTVLCVATSTTGSVTGSIRGR